MTELEKRQRRAERYIRDNKFRRRARARNLLAAVIVGMVLGLAVGLGYLLAGVM